MHALRLLFLALGEQTQEISDFTLPGSANLHRVSDFLVRPANLADVDQAAKTFPGLTVDRWRDGGNRRCFVAVDDAGNVLGHCRGIDNVYHPRSRVVVLEVLPGLRGSDVEDALMTAQLEVSTVPLSMKIHAHQIDDQKLAAKFGGVVVQMCPQWRHVVDQEFKDWVAQHKGPTEPIEDADRGEVHELQVDHYSAEHAAWSVSAERETLRQLMADWHNPGSAECYDLNRSCLMRRDGKIVAAALLFAAEDEGDAPELLLCAMPYEGPNARTDYEACLAHVVARATLGEVLMIDAHLTEQTQLAMMADVPGKAPTGEDNNWMAIVEIPVAGGPAPIPLNPALIPDEATWAQAFVPPQN